VIVMLRIGPIGFDALWPQFGRNREHRPMRRT
jgi:hypothetical protein